ncbi:MAG: discoidin domain-containing protein [Rhodomicrobium sp.]
MRLFLVCLTSLPLVLSGQAAAQKASILIETAQAAAQAIPSEALGAGLDGHQQGDVDKTYKPEALAEISSIPFYRLSYRLRTELGAEVWHWNGEGAWSDPAHAQGYWTSSDKADKPIQSTNGYRLPRRGNTHDQANHDGYSRLDDGDETSFWKSNPYLDEHFTGEENARNPQWVLINFERDVGVDGLRILWGEPFATEYEVQYWEGAPAEFYKDMLRGRWRPFPKGKIGTGTGGDVLLRLSDAPVRTRYLRILLKKGSGTAPAGSADIRDRLGFAIRELYAGSLDASGGLKDRVAHGANGKTQTKIVTSSTDPWHRAIDRDEKIEQPGIDRFMQSGLTHGRPVLMPTGLLYDTPENAAAEIRFLKTRGYDIRQIELGEEPDGQYISPEHYAALFIQFADAIHRENPALAVGGPGFQSEVDGWNAIPDDAGRTSWMKRFLGTMNEKKRGSDFGFFSFEWYPFDDLCEDSPSEQLMEHPKLIGQTLRRLDADGVPRNIPWIITEFGYSSFAGQREVEMPAALLNAEIAAQYLMAGVKTVYLYGVEPNSPIREGAACDTWGNLMAFQEGEDHRIKWRLPTYYGAKLAGQEWLGAPDGLHSLYRTRISGSGSDGSLAAYAVHRPDGQWALMVLNKDPLRARLADVRFEGEGVGAGGWRGPHEVFQYSPRQYAWQPNRDNGHPKFSKPPEQYRTQSGEPLSLRLPPMSLTVVRGAGPEKPSAGLDAVRTRKNRAVAGAE